MKINILRISFIIVLSAFLIIILIGSHLLAQLNSNSKNFSPPYNSISNISCIINNYTTISFEIDDVIFSQYDSSALQNALYVANKYNITFDLGVIAFPFRYSMDNDTFSIYKNNQDVFEVIAHGFTHRLDSSIINPINESFYSEYQNKTNSSIYGEFYVFPINKNVPINIQEDHIKRMKEIFQEFNLTTATQIFTLPYHTGDFNTTILADKYGYSLILQKVNVPKSYSEVKFGRIIASENYIDILPTDIIFTNNDVLDYNSKLNNVISLGQKRIDVSLHPINFQNLSAVDNFFGQILSQKNSNIVYRMLSDRFNCVY